jgi:hypothetical protein
MSRTLRLVVLALALFVWVPAALAGVTPGQPFPTDLETTPDATQATASTSRFRCPTARRTRRTAPTWPC